MRQACYFFYDGFMSHRLNYIPSYVPKTSYDNCHHVFIHMFLITLLFKTGVATPV